MKMSQFKKGFFLLLAVVGLSISVQAQRGDHPQKPKMTPEERVEKMSKDLNLTADQKTKFLDLEKQHQANMPRPQKDATADQKTKFMEDRKALHASQRALLTPEQAVKYDEMKAKHKGGKGDGKCKGKGKKA